MEDISKGNVAWAYLNMVILRPRNLKRSTKIPSLKSGFLIKKDLDFSFKGV